MRGIILVVASLCAFPAWADLPFYVGAGWGWTSISEDGSVIDDAVSNGSNGNLESDFDLDGTGDGISLFAGYEITQRWAVEVGYIDFGDTDTSSDIILPDAPFLGDVNLGKSTVELEIDGYYLNTQYHFPVGNYGSFDLIGGWFFADATAREKGFVDNPVNGTPPEIPLDDDKSKDKNGAMLGVAYTQKLTHTFYARGSFTYFDIDYGGVIKEPYRVGVDLIWDF